jgi:hypothetical protein
VKALSARIDSGLSIGREETLMNGSNLGRMVVVLVAMAWLAQAGIAAAAVPAHIDRLPARTTPDDATVNFPTTAVGQTSTFCQGLCYTNPGSPAGTCDGSGPEALDHNVSAPFLANHYVKGSTSPTCTGTPVTLPTMLSSGQVLWFDVNFSPTRDGTFSDTLTISGFNLFLNGSTGSSGGACTPNATTLCIDHHSGDGRFMIQVSYHTVQGGGLSGSGNAIPLSSLGVDQGGIFWFFGASNPEMLIKVLDGCTITQHFWVFYAATTNVGFTVTVTDTLTGHQAVYTNADQHTARPVQDTSASALTCP